MKICKLSILKTHYVDYVNLRRDSTKLEQALLCFRCSFGSNKRIAER